MPTLLITYDLAQPSRNGAALAEAIMAMGERWARPLASVWCVETNASVADVEAELAGMLDDEDGLLVQATTGEAVMANTMLRWTTARAERNEDIAKVERARGDVRGTVISWPVPAARVQTAA